MEWTKKEPTVCGVFWYSGEASPGCGCGCKSTEPKIAKVKADENGNLVVLFPGVAGHKPLETVNGAWMGPLEKPACS